MGDRSKSGFRSCSRSGWSSAASPCTDDVAILCVYEYMVGAERLGAALDTMLNRLNENEAITPSVLRRKMLALAASLRVETPALFCVTLACLRTYRRMAYIGPILREL